MNKEKKIAGILNAIELYAEAGRKGEGKLVGQAFIPEATMTWVADGKITAVPIAALANALDKTGAEEVTYEVSDITLAQDVAFVRIESTFSKLGSFSDMFTLAEQADGTWKIVNKIYHAK